MFELTVSDMVVVLIVLLIGSSFFSSAETAMVALDRYRLRVRVREGNRTAILIEKLLSRKDRLLGLILIGNNITNIGASVIATLLSQQLFGQQGPFFATVLLTIYILIFAEIAPKTLAALRPEMIAWPASWILSLLRLGLNPMVVVLNFCSNSVVRLFGVYPDKHRDNSPITSSDLLNMLEGGDIWLPDEYRAMLSNLLRLEESRVEDLMVPRGEVIGIDIGMNSKEINDIFKNNVYTRYPVYRGDIDDIIGVLDIRDVTGHLGLDLTPIKLRQLLRPPYFVPEGTSLPSQLFNSRRGKQNMGIVVNEYGSVQGIITLQAILEEITGKIHLGELRSTDTGLRGIFPQKDGSYIINGSSSLRDINKILTSDISSQEGAATLNGLVMENLGNLPEPGVTINLGDYSVEVMSIREDNLIGRARLRRLTS